MKDRLCLKCGRVYSDKNCPDCGPSVTQICPLCGYDTIFLTTHGVCERCWGLIEHHRMSKEKAIWYRDGKRCRYCGNRVSFVNMTKDHIIPKSAGGRNTYDNLVTACEKCNKIKGRRDIFKTGMNLLYVPGNFFREN